MRKKMVEIIIESGTKKKIQHASLFNDNVCRRIEDMTTNVCQQVSFEINQSTLQASIELVESTVSALESHSIAFVRYEKDEGRVFV